MTLRFSAVAALAFCLAVAVLERESAAQTMDRRGQQAGPTGTAQIVPQELPRPRSAPQRHSGQPIPDGFVGEAFGPYGHCSDSGCADEYSGGYYNPTWEGGGCDSCGGYGDDCCGWGWGTGLFCGAPGGRIYLIADYIYARANFSEAVSHISRETIPTPQSETNRFEQLDFEYDSSYRFGGGWRLQNCGEEIRFVYTRLTSFADSFAPDGSLLPFDPAALDAEEAIIHSFVDVDSFDLEYRKTIPLGGPLGSGGGCGDACGSACGDSCGCGCPAWDITWSGGVRYAEVDWNRTYSVFDDTEFLRQTRSVLNFEGAGPRVGVEGRRYCGQGGWFSVYLKGDFSLLLGHFDLVTLQQQDGGTGFTIDDIFQAQSVRGRHIVPVTEIETGLTANITCNSTITTGYMFSAWHDLGFRDEFTFVPALETHYDDANILGFDGFFARLELAY